MNIRLWILAIGILFPSTAGPLLAQTPPSAPTYFTTTVVALSPAVRAQTPSSFDVISIKPHPPDDTMPGMLGTAGATLNARGVTVRDLIRVAYAEGTPLQDARLVGGPPWMASERFDVTAKLPDRAEFRQVPQMLRALLAERFGLVVRPESRQLPVYALLQINPGRLGPQLRLSDDCTKRPGGGGGGALCGSRGMTPGRLEFGGVPLAPALIPALERELQRPVLDATELTGFFAGTLEWTPVTSSPADLNAPAIADKPSLSTALQEQLGLKIESRQAPMNVWVVETVNRPSPD